MYCLFLVFINLRVLFLFYSFFFFNDTATTEIYTLSLHDALPITARPLFIMCATSEGHSEPVRRRSQPNHRPSGSTRSTWASSTWAAAKASELTTQATVPPQRPASQP